MKNIKFLLLGTIFGIILIKGEVVSWFRIQEMFRFQSFHMYGTICSAIAVGMLSIFLIKKFKVKTFLGEEIKIEDKQFSKGNIIGGLMFGFGWAMTGACPGPLYALIGTGLPIVIVVLLSAVFGTYVYGILREKLPH
ncbi:MAG: YeeE/YedE family protein [Sphingobacteriaceae bacterium]|nr:YeeE/YedE family protein [Sphingobacteriaceae bacterium]